MKLKKILALVCAGLLLYGCVPASAPSPPTPTLTIPLTLPADADATAGETAEAFAQRVSAVSQGSMTIEIVRAADVTDTLRDNAGLALVPSAQIATLVPGLSMIQQPFFWKDYTHFTTALNHPDNLELADLLLAPVLNARVLGVYYNRTVTLLSRKRVYDELALEMMSIALEPYSLSRDCFTAMGARVQILPRQDAVGAFMRGEVAIIEGSTADLSALTTGLNTVHILPVNHYIWGDWLLLSDSLSQRLTPLQQAALADALAVTMEQNDRTRQEREQITVTEMAVDGVVSYETLFSITRAAGRQYLIEQVVPHSDWNNQLLEALWMGTRTGRY